MDPTRQAQIDHYKSIIEELMEPGDMAGRLALAGLVGVIHELDREALTDPLTGLPNRRALEQRDDTDAHFAAVADHEFVDRRAVMYPEPMAWAGVYVDLDHFKTVNDVLGHMYGDRMLCIVAAVLRNDLRRGDEVYRIGGDEFMIFLPMRKPATAEEICEWTEQRFADALGSLRRGEGTEDLSHDIILNERDKRALEVIGASFGAEVSEGSYLNRGAMLEKAEPLMRAAKERRGTR